MSYPLVTCTVDGCRKLHVIWGLCHWHLAYAQTMLCPDKNCSLPADHDRPACPNCGRVKHDKSKPTCYLC